MSSKKPDKNFIRALKLLSFLKQLRHQDGAQGAGFFFVNELYNILPYWRCVFWTKPNKNVTLKAFSGQSDIAENSLFAQFLKRFIKQKIDVYGLKDAEQTVEYVDNNSYAQIIKLSQSDFIHLSEEEKREYLSEQNFIVFLYSNEGLIGGLWLETEVDYDEAQHAILEDASDAFASHYKNAIRGDKIKFRDRLLGQRAKLMILFAALLFCLWPVHFSITASIEIVPTKMKVVSIPFNATLADVWVKPNENVQKGQELFKLDNTQLRNELALARQELETVRQNLSKTERESFEDPTKRQQVNMLREEVKIKSLEVNYAKERFNLSTINAENSGVVLFSDVNDLVGKPVRAGDTIMMLADPEDTEILIKIPVQNIIDINFDKPVRFFLNVAPLKRHKAAIYNTSYRPTAEPDGSLSYKARAKILSDEDVGRIGLTGSAKVYGDRTIMIFNILRRPFIAFRTFLGV